MRAGAFRFTGVLGPCAVATLRARCARAGGGRSGGTLIEREWLDGPRDEWRWLVIGEERPEKIRLGDEIMQFLIKRETSLADALDALTAVMLNALAAKYGKKGRVLPLIRAGEQVPGIDGP